MRRNLENPSTMFFWNDWDNEPGMKFCGLAAQGLLMKMLSLAARSSEHGVVRIGDHPSMREDLPGLLAPSCGETVDTIDKLIDDLITFKVVSINDRGRVFNRRMVAEARLSAARSMAGRRGADVANDRRQKSGKGISKQGGNGGGNDGGKAPTAAWTLSACPSATNGHAALGTARQDVGNQADKTAPSSFFTLSSVSKDTGTAVPEDDARKTFGVCLAFLIENGKDEKGARKLLGRWRRDHGDGAVQAAVAKARSNATSEPVAFIEACLRTGPRRGDVQRADGWSAQP